MTSHAQTDKTKTDNSKTILVRLRIVKVNQYQQLLCVVDNAKSIEKLLDTQQPDVEYRNFSASTKTDVDGNEFKTYFLKLNLPDYLKTGVQLEKFHEKRQQELKIVLKYSAFTNEKGKKCESFKYLQEA